MSADKDNTKFFKREQNINKTPEEILEFVYAAMIEKGYDPVMQIVGYFMSGDPTYITSHKNARSMIQYLERDEILETIVRHYLEAKMK